MAAETANIHAAAMQAAREAIEAIRQRDRTPVAVSVDEF